MGISALSLREQIQPTAVLGEVTISNLAANSESRVKFAFTALILAQIAHSAEEYIGRLWESFPPARFLSGLVSSNHEVGFVAINSALVTFGVWCLLFPVRKGWPSAVGFMWFWVVLEIINGIGHPAWTLRQGGYTPGVLTAPILLVSALYLAVQLRKPGRRFSPTRAASSTRESPADERFRDLTPEVLNSVSDDDLADAIVHHVVLHTSAAATDRLSVVRTMPAGVRAIYTTWLVDAEVCNGGFNQFFWNQSRELGGEALAGYELMGAEAYATVMRGALATWETERSSQARFHTEGTLKAFSASYAHTTLGDADAQYYALHDAIRDVWPSFARANPELLVRSLV